MTPLNKAIALQLAAVAVLAAAVATSHRWVPSVFVDVGSGLLLVATFGIAVLLLSIGLVWVTVLSWFEYRRGAVQGLPNRATIFLGAVVGGGLAIYALRFWTGL